MSKPSVTPLDTDDNDPVMDLAELKVCGLYHLHEGLPE